MQRIGRSFFRKNLHAPNLFALAGVAATSVPADVVHRCHPRNSMLKYELSDGGAPYGQILCYIAGTTNAARQKATRCETHSFSRPECAETVRKLCISAGAELKRYSLLHLDDDAFMREEIHEFECTEPGKDSQ